MVFVGALASWQGIGTVLDAVNKPEWPSTVDVVIAGDGKEEREGRGAARNNARIRWLGTIPYAESPALMAGSLAALVPKADAPSSRYGLSPLKLYEALACGVPVVASDLPGLSEVVRTHGCGLTFPAGNPAALAASIARLAENPEMAREMGRRGREAAVAFYSWDARAGQTEQVLLQAARTDRTQRRSQLP